MDHEFLIPVIEDVEAAMSSIGIHMTAVDAAVFPDEGEDEDFNDDEVPNLVKEGKVKIYMSTMFTVSDSAWSDRVLNPESYEIQKEFKRAAPTEFEVELESLKDIVDNWDDED
jgi:hypothetical protein